MREDPDRGRIRGAAVPLRFVFLLTMTDLVVTVSVARPVDRGGTSRAVRCPKEVR
jgi:hypothetical protein